MIRKALFLVFGSVTLMLALIGIVVPGLPTTPLLLVTLFAYSRSTKKLETWFKKSILYEKFLKTYEEKRAMTVKQKVRIQILSSLIMIFVIFIAENLIIKVVIGLCLIIKNYVFTFKIKTLGKNKE